MPQIPARRSEVLPIPAGNWDDLNDLLAVGHLPDGSHGGLLPASAIQHLDIFSHSYGEGQAVKANRWSSKLARRLGVDYWGERNRSVTGSTIANNASPASWSLVMQDINSGGSMPVVPTGPTWNMPNFHVVVIHQGINDLNTLDGRTVIGNLDAVKQAFRAVVSRYRAGAIREQSDSTVALGGTWNTANSSDPPYNSSTSYAYSSVNTSTITITIPSGFPAGATIALGFTAEASAGGTWTVTKNGAAHGSIVAVNPNAGFGAMPYVYRMTNMSAGDVIVATLSAVATRSIFDYWQCEAGTETSPDTVPPLILLSKQPKLSSYAAYPSGLVTDASVANLNTVIDQVAAEFGSSVVAVDLDTLLGANTKYFGSDFLHPNDLGHAKIAEKLYTTILTNWSLVPNTYADVNPAPYLSESFNGHAGIVSPSSRGWFRGNLTLVAGTTYFSRFTVERVMNLTNVILELSTAASVNDNIEVAIYRVYKNGHLARAFTTGAVAGKLNGATGRVVIAMAASAALQPGYVYYAAVQCPAIGGTAAVISRADFTSASYVTAFGTAFPEVESASILALGTPLPATVTTAPTASGNTAIVNLSEV